MGIINPIIKAQEIADFVWNNHGLDKEETIYGYNWYQFTAKIQQILSMPNKISLEDECELCGESIKYAKTYGCPTAHKDCKHES